ncbi:MAG: efflux RND transporter periplasmic adaptor subunit, partial [Gemmatimonadaceae bacterium]
GESVFGEIAVETRPNTVVVPVAALVPEEDGYKVFVVDGKGMALAREVKVGGRTETRAEILEGLKGGETVVSQGAYGVEDSVKVSKPVPVKP